MIKVRIKNPSSRAYWLAQWNDPVTGEIKTRSTKKTTEREALKFAARLEDELNSGQFVDNTLTTWDELRKRFETEVSATRALKTRLKTQAMFNAVERLFKPKLLQTVAQASFVSRFASALREETIEETIDGKVVTKTIVRKNFTIRGHLAELRKVLRWARDLDLIQKMPVIRMPPKAGGMKGRPITAEEVDRMLVKIPEVVQKAFVESWEYFLTGMNLSGLRLEEAMKLSWDDDRQFMVDLSHRRPMFRIQAQHEKGRKFRLLPMTPDFAEFLLKTPESQRHGLVFHPLTYPRGGRPVPHRPTHEHAGRVISQVGEAAGVRVSDTKFASAHDLRRSFGYRWSKLVMPKVLQELMRHESIQTTMEFYVGNMAEDAADAVWKSVERDSGNTFGNTSGKSGSENPASVRKTHKKQA